MFPKLPLEPPTTHAKNRNGDTEQMRHFTGDISSDLVSAWKRLQETVIIL